MAEHTKADAVHGATNVLVLAPLTPGGHRTHLKLVKSTSTNETRLAAVTYTQPPQPWLKDWEQHIGSLPRETHFIHVSGMAHTELTDDQIPERVMTEIVDPTEPMGIIVLLSQQLQAWMDGET
jgi:hypothetical protein